MFTSSRLAPPRTWSSGDVERPLPVVCLDQPPEDSRPGDVRALAGDDEGGVLVDDEGLEPAEARTRSRWRDGPRGKPVHRRSDARNVFRRGAAAAADAVDEALLGKRPQQPCGLVRCLVVAAERVRQPRVRVAEHRYGGDPGQVGEERPHLGGAEGAVDPDGERVGVLDGDPEGIDGLAGERASAAVDDRDGDDQRDLLAPLVLHVLDGGDRGLRVQRVEDRLDEQQVGAAVEQSARDVRVAVAHLVEGGHAVGRVVDTRGERQRDAGRAEGAGDHARAEGSHGAPRDLCAGAAELVAVVFEPVLALGRGVRRERVRRDDVGARFEVGAVDRLDVVGPRQAEHVDVAAQVLGVAAAEARAAHVLLRQAERLHLRAHGAVEHHDSLREKCCQSVGRAHAVSFDSRATAPVGATPASPSSRPRGRGLFRRLVTRSPSCLKAVRVVAA